MPGACWDLYAVGLNQSSDGNYQKHLDIAIPPFSPIYTLELPTNVRRRGRRESTTFHINPLQECLAREVQKHPDIIEQSQTRQWPPCYTDHPLVIKAQSEGRALPLPILVYLDAVRYTAPLAGRSDSILGIWAYNAISNKRHLLVSLRTLDLCRCGCQGWCTLFPIMLSVYWMLKSLAQGERPATRHDNSAFKAGDQLFKLIQQQGSALGFTAVLCWLKGDWSEASHTLALPSVVSTHSSCPFCSLGQCSLHDRYTSMCFPPKQLSYDAACATCEVSIVIRSEAERAQLLQVLVYAKELAGVKKGGRMVSATIRIDGTQLQRGDRLEP